MSESINEQVDMRMEKNTTSKAYLIFKEVILSFGLIGILVPVIVDFSINRKLTWSLIVCISILYFFSGIITFFLCKKNRCIKTLGAYSILLIPYLFGLAVTIGASVFSPSKSGFLNYALPISIIWLAIIWGVILLGIIIKLNKFFLIGILFLLAIIGTTLTNMIALRIPWIETFYVDEIVTQIFVYIGGAIFFFYLGIISNINKKVINKVH